MEAIAKRKSHLGEWGWFCSWALVGAGYAFGISAIGIFTVPAAIIATVFLARRRPIRGAFGALVGAGALFLYIAYLNRQGPGETCYTTATGGGCNGHLNPLPWLVVGLICVVGGIAAHARQNR